VEIIDSYILLKDNEAYLFGALITPLPTSSSFISESQRNRKLLLHRIELNKIISAVERKGLTLVPTALYWKNGHIKLEIGIARGKKMHDKRETEKKRDWQRQKARLVRH
jgi:SsrA-binding protein